MAEQRRSPQHRSIDRRRFIGFLIAAPTLAVVVDWSQSQSAEAAIPTLPQPEDLFDLGDLQNLAAAPTSGLISVRINTDGTAFFAVPRAEVGQGMTTAIAMMVSEELDLPIDKVQVGLADARPELLMNQLTGGSNSMRSMYTPVRTAAAIARQRLIDTAAAQWGVAADQLSTSAGTVTGPGGRSCHLRVPGHRGGQRHDRRGDGHTEARVAVRRAGYAAGRIDAHDIVTGRKQFAMDMQVPGALPTMVARPPTINGKVVSVNNESAVLAMPGITDVAAISTGVAIRAQTFGQCIDAIQVIDVTWGPGTVDGESDSTVLRLCGPRSCR